MLFARLSTSLLRLARTGLVAGCAFTVVHAGGIKSERLLASILRRTPEATLVAVGEQFKRAETAAAEIPMAEAFFGVGHSMEPLYASKTAIVVAPIPFKDLEKGMTVVYVNSRGRLVAHSLTGDLPRGWIAQGVANSEEDDDLVTKENLVGVIIMAFAEMHSDGRVALTKNLIAKGRLAANRT